MIFCGLFSTDSRGQRKMKSAMLLKIDLFIDNKIEYQGTSYCVMQPKKPGARVSILKLNMHTYVLSRFSSANSYVQELRS